MTINEIWAQIFICEENAIIERDMARMAEEIDTMESYMLNADNWTRQAMSWCKMLSGITA